MSSSVAAPINAVVDLSHWNTVSSFANVKADGIAGIVHKATQGLQYVDPQYAVRQPHAIAAGLWWGAYHFGTGDDPIAQAEHFLSSAKPDAHTLMALDLERNSQGPSMGLVQAEQFAAHIQNKTGRWPLLYTGLWYLNPILPDAQSTMLANCPLWLAVYDASLTAPHLKPQWKTWTFWQYSDGKTGAQPWTVNGIGPCDRDKFNGTLDDLAKLWGIAPTPAPAAPSPSSAAAEERF